jgi:hypothetical protein
LQADRRSVMGRTDIGQNSEADWGLSSPVSSSGSRRFKMWESPRTPAIRPPVSSSVGSLPSTCKFLILLLMHFIERNFPLPSLLLHLYYCSDLSWLVRRCTRWCGDFGRGPSFFRGYASNLQPLVSTLTHLPTPPTSKPSPSSLGPSPRHLPHGSHTRLYSRTQHKRTLTPFSHGRNTQ